MIQYMQIQNKILPSRPNFTLGGSKDLVCLTLLSLLCLTTYTINMLVAEITFDDSSIFEYIIVKHCVGDIHHLLSPFVLLLSYPEIFQAVGKVGLGD